MGISHMPFKVEYIFNPIGFFKEFADRFWIGIKELRFRPDYLDLEEVRLNINNFWIDIQTILSKCGDVSGSTEHVFPEQQFASDEQTRSESSQLLVDPPTPAGLFIQINKSVVDPQIVSSNPTNCPQ